MNTSRKGNGKEKATEHWLEAKGYLVGSRRHIGGAGDLLAVKGSVTRLIEVKATQTAYAHFGPQDRKELFDLAKQHEAWAYLAWWEPGAKEPKLIHSSEWPR